MLTKLYAALLVVIISSLLFIGYTYVNQYSQTVRWQARAIKNYNTQVKDQAEGRLQLAVEPKQEAWWHQNSVFVSAQAWADLGGNLLAIIICSSSLLGRLWIRIKRKTRRLARQRGNNKEKEG